MEQRRRGARLALARQPIGGQEPEMTNELYYGDNLDVLRRKIGSESVDLCYIDPPFNSKRNYFQIYNNQGSEDRAQAQAFVDTWNWGDEAADGLDYILDLDRLAPKAGETRWTEQTVELIRGLEKVPSTKNAGSGQIPTLCFFTRNHEHISSIHIARLATRRSTRSSIGRTKRESDTTTTHRTFSDQWVLVSGQIFASNGVDSRIRHQPVGS